VPTASDNLKLLSDRGKQEKRRKEKLIDFFRKLKERREFVEAHTFLLMKRNSREKEVGEGGKEA